MAPTAPPMFRPAGWRSDAQRKAESDARRQRDPEYQARRRLYNSKAWKTARTEFLATHPYCADCEDAGRRPTFARHVDHIVAVADGGAALDPDNFRALCHSCHSVKTAARDGGFGRPRVSAEP